MELAVLELHLHWSHSWDQETSNRKSSQTLPGHHQQHYRQAAGVAASCAWSQAKIKPVGNQ